jgi:hypothetical protein
MITNFFFPKVILPLPQGDLPFSMFTVHVWFMLPSMTTYNQQFQQIDVSIVYLPSPEEKNKSSLEINPNNISSRIFFADDQMMEDLFGDDYTMDEIREETGVQHCGEEGHVVQSIVGPLKVPKTRQSHVHSPPVVDPSATLLTPQQGGQES